MFFRCRLLRIARARPFLSRTTKKMMTKESSTVSPARCPSGEGHDAILTCWVGATRTPRTEVAREEAIVASSRREERGARGGCFFFAERGCEKREEEKKNRARASGPAFLRPLPLSPSLKQSTLCRLGFFFSPRNHERPRSARFPPRRRPRVGEFCSLGLREGRAKARRHAGKRDFILFF